MTTIEHARLLGHSIQNDESYKAVTLAADAIDEDAELSAMIADFGTKRDNIPNTDDNAVIEAADKELEALYNDIMNHPKMQKFEAAKTEFNLLMERVLAIVTKSADGEDPETAEPDAPGCGGECCSCGKCGG